MSVHAARTALSTKACTVDSHVSSLFEAGYAAGIFVYFLSLDAVMPGFELDFFAFHSLVADAGPCQMEGNDSVLLWLAILDQYALL